ncbi:DUF2493 domain-containing protein [Prevotella lacticifex]|uniref:YspA cpYpsA-related SLOG domain-containing protein n=1 Tax=Prevotella lacticifex TaxID=2854755 RepID=A0A9R1C821_9BACT|nr:DUF2493 domain-containing protein [Prevotella lacticifex]GJG37862.1 hypothetical protein PRLR5003_30190 [Prevotella lacticifex]GJG40793.1 hypothetical protein PRLR5019_27640 [Prevotella lacticifex]GJG43736.1 hypothetical protein PRLR5025_25220 [Prevotella lacticifex]GJG47517.1 hypothetical protein PRLR5027_31120 [Prevotella lacticifex]GJG49831.1 hypothetical protein PRLR5052_22440 [Prevotella lacticifex]
MDKEIYGIIIAGGRDFDDYSLLQSKCLPIIERQMVNHDVIIMSGHAKGADMLGERFAEEHGLKLEVYPADWKAHYRSAGFRRNEQMGDIANGLIAFWDGESHGTKHMIEYAKSKGLDVNVVRY